MGYKFSRRMTQPYVTASGKRLVRVKRTYNKRVENRAAAASRIQKAWRGKTSQFRRNSYKTNKGRSSNTISSNGKLNPTKDHIANNTMKLLKKLTKVGIVEDKVKVFKETRLTSTLGFTNNPLIGSMGFVVYNFSSGPISAADNLVATGVPISSTISPPLPAPPVNITSVQNLKIWQLARAPVTGTSVQTTAATLQGKSMFCHSLDFTVGIQVNPMLSNAASDMALNPVALYCVPWVFRAILVRQRPGAQTSGFSGSIPPSFAERLLLPYAGAEYRVGLGAASLESGEGNPTPQDALYRKLNFQNYEVIRDFNFRISPASINGNVSGASTVGYKRLKFHIPINQELDYDMDVAPSNLTNVMNANMRYSLLIMSGVPAISHAVLPEVVSLGVNATTAGQWSSTFEGRMTFTDS